MLVAASVNRRGLVERWLQHVALPVGVGEGANESEMEDEEMVRFGMGPCCLEALDVDGVASAWASCYSAAVGSCHRAG